MHLRAFHFHYFKWKDKDNVCAKKKRKKKRRYSLVQNLQGPSLSLLHYLFILCVMSDSTIRGSTALRHRGTSQMSQRCHELSVQQVWLWVIVHEWESVFVVRILSRELRPGGVWLLNIYNIPNGARWHEWKEEDKKGAEDDTVLAVVQTRRKKLQSWKRNTLLSKLLTSRKNEWKKCGLLFSESIASSKPHLGGI